MSKITLEQRSGETGEPKVSWWNLIRNWNNPTRSWQLDPTRQLVLDLDSHTLCKFGMGDPIERLSFIGPATRWSYDLEFSNLGIVICPDEDNRVAELTTFFGHPAESQLGKFPGDIRYRGELIELGVKDTEETVTSRFGDAYWRDKDQDEIILFFERESCEWQFEFSLDGQLKCLCITKPGLADPAQRTAYGVTKAWPPP